MAAVPVALSGVLYDKHNRTQQSVVIMGELSLYGLEVGGGPIIPPGTTPQPPGIWGGGNEPFPTPPIHIPPQPGQPPGIWGGGNQPFPTPPIYIPPNIPPVVTPPSPPNPGDPTTPVPPPAGSAGWPVQPVTPPPYIVVMYPGIGPVVVAPPAQPPAPAPVKKEPSGRFRRRRHAGGGTFR